MSAVGIYILEDSRSKTPHGIRGSGESVPRCVRLQVEARIDDAVAQTRLQNDLLLVELTLTPSN